MNFEDSRQIQDSVNCSVSRPF